MLIRLIEPSGLITHINTEYITAVTCTSKSAFFGVHLNSGDRHSFPQELYTSFMEVLGKSSKIVRLDKEIIIKE